MFSAGPHKQIRAKTIALRHELLSLNGIGPETADSILLYGGGLPIFPVDAYTRRIVERHGILPSSAKYDEVRSLFEDSFPAARKAAALFNELHALIVQVGKDYCRKQPNCNGCPLQKFLPGPLPAASKVSGPSAVARRSS